jgi:hypothetical protein
MTVLVDVISAYLSPLLKKDAASQRITWEDLEASLEASKKVLQEQSPDNTFILVRR